jgi:hypothetical protein
MYDLGPSALIEVHAPDTIWKTVQPPVPVSLPLTIPNSKFSGPGRSAITVITVVFIISLFTPALLLSITHGKPGALVFFLLTAGITPFILINIYYISIIDALSNGDCLFVGVNGFIDIRMLTEPIKWTNITAIKIVCTRSGIIGLRLKLTEPCAFNKKFAAMLPGPFFKYYHDSQNVYIPMRSLKYDINLLAEVFKNRISEATRH